MPILRATFEDFFPQLFGSNRNASIFRNLEIFECFDGFDERAFLLVVP
jgi:hypothetical protein